MLFAMCAELVGHCSSDAGSSGNGTIRGDGVNYEWNLSKGTLPPRGKYTISYKVDAIDFEWCDKEIIVGVVSRNAVIHSYYRFDETPGCYLWCSCTDGDGSYLAAEGEIIQGEIPQESNVGSRIDVIVDQDSSTVEFLLDGVPVGKGGTSCKAFHETTGRSRLDAGCHSGRREIGSNIDRRFSW